MADDRKDKDRTDKTVEGSRPAGVRNENQQGGDTRKPGKDQTAEGSRGENIRR